ncbi:NDR1/HIN1-like protein 1 [Nicotiana tomentosiformis]|uniref:NDR1/HIN1-like protein 1 n=1 Tax=Nicotiana tomentosiformis TaxID=4098 RepID=UPI00051B8437|nr:NDR1/HIN1-like protein 1 [Nicotiana tomentosiformis]
MSDQQKSQNEGGYTQRPSPLSSSKNPAKTLCTFLLIFLILAGLTLLIGWLIYRPHKPNFTLVNAAIYQLNITSLPYMFTTMQFTVLVRNPNRRVSLFYDQISALVSYKGQAITPPVMLPPLFQDTKSTVPLSPVIGGASVPVSVEVANGLVVDETYGMVALRLVFMGKLRYKAAFVRTRHYGIYVKCDMLVGYKKGFVGQVPLLGSPDCEVDV